MILDVWVCEKSDCANGFRAVKKRTRRLRVPKCFMCETPLTRVTEEDPDIEPDDASGG